MKTVALAYIADGYLAAAAYETDYGGPGYFYDLEDEEGFEVFIESLPDDLADKCIKQGCGDQVFRDGYEAANEVAKYLGSVVDKLTGRKENGEQYETD